MPVRPERIRDFADLARASDRKRDAALLRATTELFVVEPAHSEDEVRRYEELAIHLLAKVTPEDRVFVAERLSTCTDAPASVLRTLARDTLAIARPILLNARALKPIDLLSIIAGTDVEHHRLIARRAGLSDEVTQALALKGDPEVLASLGKTPATPDLDRTVPTGGLYQSNRLDPWRYLALARPARLRLIADIAANPPPLPDESNPKRLDRAFRSILSAARIVGFARSGQRDAVIAAISEGLDLPAALVIAAVNDAGGELLAIMLKALRLDDSQARQVFLLASPTGLDVAAFFPLADLFSGMEPSVAETLIDAWRTEVPGRPRHEAFVEPRRERPGAAATRSAPQERRDADTARRA
jgi:uncharacterized protein (DUF2336 family)